MCHCVSYCHGIVFNQQDDGPMDLWTLGSVETNLEKASRLFVAKTSFRGLRVIHILSGLSIQEPLHKEVLTTENRKTSFRVFSCI